MEHSSKGLVERKGTIGGTGRTYDDELLASGFQLYPPLTDAALSFAIDAPGFLPWSFGTVEIREKAGSKIFSYVSNQIKTSETRTFDIILADEAGQISGFF